MYSPLKNGWVILITLSFILPSCYTTKTTVTPIKSIMDSWIGHSEHDLIVSYGPPTTSTSDGQNGKVLSYEKAETIGLRSPGYYAPGAIYRSPDLYTSHTETHYMQFFVKSTGEIYLWRTNYSDTKTVERIPNKKNTRTAAIVAAISIVAIVALAILSDQTNQH